MMKILGSIFTITLFLISLASVDAEVGEASPDEGSTDLVTESQPTSEEGIPKGTQFEQGDDLKQCSTRMRLGTTDGIKHLPDEWFEYKVCKSIVPGKASYQGVLMGKCDRNTVQSQVLAILKDNNFLWAGLEQNFVWGGKAYSRPFYYNSPTGLMAGSMYEFIVTTKYDVGVGDTQSHFFLHVDQC